MKKIIALVMAITVLSLCIMLSSCSLIETGNVEIAMVTDGGSVSESSMNQAVWASVSEFAIANEKNYNAYHPATQEHDDLVDAMMQAVVNGAKVVVCSGKILEGALFEVQDLFPDVRFMLIDGEPRGVASTTDVIDNNKTSDADGNDETDGMLSPDAPVEQVRISENVYCVTFREDQAGYLAGYIAVRDGYTKFGFVSESDSKSDMMYGAGFLQGIQDAAREMGMIDRINVKFRYSGDNAMLDEHTRSIVEKWYITGTEIVLASGATCVDVIAAAEAQNGRVICTDNDHATVSNLVVTTAMKFVDTPVKEALTSLYNNGIKWDEAHAGKTVQLGVAEDGVGLPTKMSSWRFGNYTVDQYDALAAKMVAGEIALDQETDIFTDHDITIDFAS